MNPHHTAFIFDSMRPNNIMGGSIHSQAKLRVSESQRSTLEASVLQTTETISALSNQITELETLKNAEANRASSLEVKLSLEADARMRAEELAVEAAVSYTHLTLPTILLV